MGMTDTARGDAGFRFAVSKATVGNDFPALLASLLPGPDVEAGYLTGVSAFHELVELVRTRRRRFGWHFPIALADQPRQETRPGLETATLELLDRDLEVAGPCNPEYAIVHLRFERPVDNGPEHLERISRLLVERLERAGVPPAVEPKVLFDDGWIPAWIARHPERLPETVPGLRYCLDIGDTYLAALTEGADPYEWMARMAPWSCVVHLHAVRWPRERPYHVWEPVHPDRRGVDGLLDVDLALQAIVPSLPESCTLTFEHLPMRCPSIEYAREGYHWAEERVKELRG
jgi:hypothetical protein